MSSLGYSGILPPIAANFAPHVIFLTIGLALLYWREKAR
jgi:lipopolysaccharide export LptBFGC system permease protein LptF